MRLQTPKGFRDFLPEEAIVRKNVVEKIERVFERFGFDPLETPTLEYAETLMGKYGEEEKLIYQFNTKGGDEVALKYDQTVPLARVVAQYGPTGMQKLPMPFKRYQIQSAFRGENTQKGRYREFLQCDADIIGVSTPLADADILALVYEIYKELGLEIIIKINDRSLLSAFEPKHLSAIDKLNKIGVQGVMDELQMKGLTASDAAQALQIVKKLEASQNLKEIARLYEKMGYPKESLQFDPSLVRGLDYYTGLILEVVLKSDPDSSSLCGGGRWDNMIGKFTGNDLPAVGFAIGLDRTIEAMAAKELIKEGKTNIKILVTYSSPQLEDKAVETVSKLRKANINADIWLNPDTKLEKQLKYADSKGIPCVIILGVDNLGEQLVLKDLNKREQKTVSLDQVIKLYRSG